MSARRFDGDALAAIALEAGALIMKIFDAGFEVEHKDDKSPVTEADQRAEKLILARIEEQLPGLPVLAEESAAAGNIPELGQLYACVDPLDGTKEFVNRRTDFTVNIALIEDGEPVQGVVYAPALKRLFVAETPVRGWSADAEPGGDVPAVATRTALKIRPAPPAITAVASRSHRTAQTDAWLARYNVGDIRSAGSSLKFCLVAAGEADLYPRMGPTMEWDTAAGHAVVRAAGGRVTDEAGAPLRYNKADKGYTNPHFIVYGGIDPK